MGLCHRLTWKPTSPGEKVASRLYKRKLKQLIDHKANQIKLLFIDDHNMIQWDMNVDAFLKYQGLYRVKW